LPQATLEQLIAVTASPAPIPAIEQMRQRASVGGNTAPYTLEQLERLVARVQTGASVADLSAATGLGGNTVIDAVVGLGTWLTHRHGKAAVEFVSAGSLAEPPLFYMPPQTLKEGNDKTAAQLHQVELPEGFDPKALGRDVRASLGAILAVAPAMPELQRFMDRAWRPQQPKAVTYESLSAVAFFVRLGRAGDLPEVNADSPGFAQLVVDSYDLLEVARMDAISALGASLTAGVYDRDVVTSHLGVARQLFDERLQRLLRLAERAGCNDEVNRLLDRERSAVSRRIEAAPNIWLAPGVWALSDTAIRRIAIASGIPVERDFELEREVRSRLAAIGRKADADVLVPAGVNAIRRGASEEFWQGLVATS
jgi:hypothetical protein